MFTILEVLPYTPTFSIFARKKLKNGYIETEKIPLNSSAFFYKATLSLPKNNKFPVSLLEKTLPNGYQHIILTDNSVACTLPFSLYEPSTFPQIVFIQTILHFVKERPIYKNKKLAWMDVHGIYYMYLARFSPYVKEIVVYTEEDSKYFEVSQTILEKTGLQIQIKPFIRYPKDCDAALILAEHEKKIFENKFFDISEKNMYTAEKSLLIPKEFSTFLPDNVSDLLFFSALYEICHIIDLETWIYPSLKRRKATELLT